MVLFSLVPLPLLMGLDLGLGVDEINTDRQHQKKKKVDSC